MTKARDLANFNPTNITDTGTEGTKVASGTTAERGSTTGQIRFNSTTGLAEYYTGTAFKSIDAAPTVTSIDVTEVASDGGGNQTIVITGTGFNSGATVTYIGASGTNFNASTVTVNSDTQITAVAPKSSFLNAQEPYGVKVVNTTGLSATLASQINVDTSPTWSTASGSLGSFYNFGTVNVTPTASDAEGDTIAYSVQSGSLPSGLSLNSSTGAITGTIGAVGSSTTFTFTLRATSNSKTADRQFTITNAGASAYVYSYTGSNQTFTVPSGVTSFQTYMWGAGGNGASSNASTRNGGDGGAGGYVAGTISNFSAGTTFSLLVGQGTLNAFASTAVVSYGGGGAGCDNSNGTQPLGGHGGGRSEISIGGGSNTPAGTRILVAGAGGGGGAFYHNGEPANNCWGGDGAYPTGQTSEGGGTPPTGGSQSAGGNAGSGASGGVGNSPTNGSAGIGGMARSGNQNIDNNYGRPGGGGGGYYGGGGGDGGNPNITSQGGAGGSSYYNSSYVSNFAHATGSNTTAPENSNTYYASGIAKGGTGNAGNNRTGALGGNGRIVLVY